MSGGRVDIVESVKSLGDRAGDVAAFHIEGAFRAAIPSGPQVVKGERSMLVTTGEPHPFGNFAIGLDSEDHASLEDFIPPLVATRAPASFLYPGSGVSEPVHRRLGQDGFECHGAMPAMICDIDGVPATSLPKGYEFEEVTTPVGRVDWVETLSAGYGIPLGVAALFKAEPGPGIRYFAASHRGRMASVSALCYGDGVAGIYCVATLESERGKGLGAHMTAEPLRIARDEGYRVGVLQASEMGYKIYERLGFRDVGQVQIYFRSPEG